MTHLLRIMPVVLDLVVFSADGLPSMVYGHVQIVRTTQEFKTNCNLVIIDFLIRHGYITPDQPNYLKLLMGLRQGEWS